jgi:uncharacterized protein YndB with AHSA1/START domain
MMKSMTAGLVAALLLAAPAGAGMKQLPMVRLVAESEVAAPPAAVWNWLTQGKNLVTWCPAWKSPANARVNLAKVGDVLDFTDSWGNGGRSVVTFLEAPRELRVAHEPNDGSYVCQARISLAAGGAGTRVTWTEQYTDESSEADRAATAAKTADEMTRTLAALKQGVEARPR